MDDYKIALGALLDANAKGDIDKQLNAIKDLSVTISKATLSNDVINDIKRQLTQNGIDLKLVFGNVNQITNQAKQTGQQIGQQIQSGINSAIQKGNLQKDFFFSADKKNDTAKRAQEYFRGISNGIVTVTEQMENLDDKSELKGFIVNIKNAKGEIESLKYSLRNILDDNGNVTGQKFAYVSGSINDANAIKQFEELNKVITDYEIKLANLKTKYSNMNVDYSAFNDVFNNFKLGIGTANDLALAFNQLENSAKKGVQSLKSQTSSFDPIQQTLNNMRDLPSMLTALEANMSGVKDKTSIAEISVDKLRESFDKLDAEMQSNGGKVPITDEWLKNYRDLMSTVTSATKQVDALKKAEASDNSQTQKQANYYSTILSNYREIYSLKQKLLTAGKEETKVIQEQIRSLNSSNASINKQLGKQGLKDSNWQTQVDDLKEELDYSLRISEARQKDKANQSSLNNAQREAIQIVEELEQAYQRVQDIKIKIASLDKAKDGEKISTLSQEEESAQAEYKQLYDRLRKRKNYDKESWNETKSAIDSATQSAIEYNNSRAQDTLNKAQKTEVANFNILKNKWEEQGVLVGEFKEKVETMESSLASVGSKGELDNLKLQIKDLKTEADKIAKVDEIQLSLDTEEYSKDIKIINDKLAKVGKFTLSDQSNADIFDKAQKSAKSLESTYIQLKSTMADANATDQQKIDLENKYQQELITTKNLLSQINLNKDDELVSVGDNRRVNMIASLNSYLAKNTAMTKENKKLIESWIAKLASSDDMTVGAIKNINSEFKQLDATLRQTGQLGLSTWDKFKQAVEKFGGWSLVTGGLTAVSNKIHEATTEINNLDDILTEISKTSNLTTKELKKLGLESYDTASKYGRTASDYLSGMSSMSQSGFYGKQGQAMTEQSLLAQAAGDISAEIADKYIIATNAAYKFSGATEKLNAVIDGQNSIANQNSVALEDMAIAMSEAGTVASSYNVAVEDFSAMVGTIEAVTKAGGDEVGNSIKSILINLQNVTSSKIVKTLDKANASMTEFVNGSEQLRNPIDILRDLAKTFNELEDTDPLRAEILTNVAGKYQSAKLAALLENMTLFDKMLVDYSEGSGSALEEANKSANNLTGRLNALQNSINELVNTFISADGLKLGVNILNELVQGANNLVNAFTPLGTLALGGGLFAGIKNVGQAKMWACLIYAYPC